MRLGRLGRGLAWAAAGAAVLLVSLHFGIQYTTRMAPPEVPRLDGDVEVIDSVRRLGASSLRRRGELLEARLEGTPVEIGHAHSRLLYPEMDYVEGVMLGEFRRRVPVGVRTVLLDLSAWRYRSLADGFELGRRQEIAAQALGFSPDPFAGMFPTYQRFVYLNALYDIALSFERSPLVGCTTFFVDARERGGSLLLARAFDFDVHSVFDRNKVVFAVFESGKIPLLSVSWPGLVGVVSGVNRERVTVVAHGARAGETRTQGEPVVHALRRVLSEAKTAQAAVQLLDQREPLVSHLVIVADATGAAFAVERAPGHPSHVRPLGTFACVTNHFEGALSRDPKNERVRRETSTLTRRARGDALGAAKEVLQAPDALALLRDRRSPDGAELPLGDRRAIDAQIAAHGVVVDLTAGVVWVSEGPNLVGRFVAFDLAQALASPAQPAGPARTFPADPLLHTQPYREHQDAPR
ncbi:MAG: hypothetical protein KF718_16420 [Polyangiaceae bacterium]|nr:hypothetical protein [Polyangiaceae bacterium]